MYILLWIGYNEKIMQCLLDYLANNKIITQQCLFSHNMVIYNIKSIQAFCIKAFTLC